MSEPDGDGIGIQARIEAYLGKLASRASQDQEQYDRRSRMMREIRQVPIQPGQIALSGGTGILQSKSQLGPPTGYVWDVFRLVCAGFTAGTVIAFINAAVIGGVVQGNPEILTEFPSAGLQTFGKRQGLLAGDDQIVFSASSITGQVQISGRAVQIPEWALPDYIL